MFARVKTVESLDHLAFFLEGTHQDPLRVVFYGRLRINYSGLGTSMCQWYVYKIKKKKKRVAFLIRKLDPSHPLIIKGFLCYEQVYIRFCLFFFEQKNINKNNRFQRRQSFFVCFVFLKRNMKILPTQFCFVFSKRNKSPNTKYWSLKIKPKTKTKQKSYLW